MHQMGDPAWAGDGQTIDAACNYQLILDNLMDLTHEEFVHGSSIGQDELSQSDFGTPGERHRQRHPMDDRRRCRRRSGPRTSATSSPDFNGKVDRWQIIHF